MFIVSDVLNFVSLVHSTYDEKNHCLSVAFNKR